MAERKGDKFNSTWVATQDQIEQIVNALVYQGFTLYNQGMPLRDGFLWYVDDADDHVTISNFQNNGSRILTCTLGANPIISDALGGLDSLKKARGKDFRRFD
ncbi:MAG TPA: hypothetical protein VFI61_01780 [Patescibacteria group bacterium]|nr:hypothetical protein [Patescibacteria group bacterium]